MDSTADDAFLVNYKKLEHESDSSNLDLQRKCTSQIHKFALQSLDGQSTCFLLDKNLSKLNELVRKDSNQTVSNRNDRIKEMLNAKNFQADQIKIKSNLSNIDLRSLMKPLPCAQDSSYLTCPKSETVSKQEFEQFKSAFSQNKPSFPEFKEKKLAKNFAPQSCRNIGNNFIPKTAPSKEEIKPASSSAFKTAREEFQVQSLKKYGNTSGSTSSTSNYNNSVGISTGQKRKLGIRRNINSKFVSPLLSTNSSEEMSGKSEEWPCEVDERLKNIDPKMVELIRSEIMDIGSNVTWNDIAGLEFAKTAIQEAVVWPMLRPDIFTGLRRPPKGILLFGPPGTGKTLIGKCVASQSKSTFFSISASSLTSKWVGDGEKMVRALFAVARVHQPSVIFIDEIDSLLSQRNETEHESSRRIKTEFLVQLDGATTDGEERLLLIGATNRPQELDEAARRRFVKRLYVPLPEREARLQLVTRLIASERHELNQEDFQEVAKLSEGYSGADIRNLCSEASLGPIRAIDMNRIESIQAADVRPLLMIDFQNAFTRVRSSVSPNDLNQYTVWDQTYGSGI